IDAAMTQGKRDWRLMVTAVLVLNLSFVSLAAAQDGGRHEAAPKQDYYSGQGTRHVEIDDGNDDDGSGKPDVTDGEIDFDTSPFPATSIGALLDAHLKAIGSFGNHSAKEYEESLARLRSVESKAIPVLLDTYYQRPVEDRIHRLWIIHTLGALEAKAAIDLFEEIARQPSLPAFDEREFNDAGAELLVRSFSVLGLRRVAGAGTTSALEGLVRVAEDVRLHPAVRNRAIDGLIDLEFDLSRLKLSAEDEPMRRVERPSEPPEVPVD
ncbi:MAG: hypothetical protein AAF449_18015, partial [Myxococcota bacterium]